MMIVSQLIVILLLSISLQRGSCQSDKNTTTIACDDKRNRIFACADGSCISREVYCDGRSECPDGSDEFFANATDHLGIPEFEDGIACKFRRRFITDDSCILPSRYKCDHEIDCVGGKDECDCPHTFQCANGDCVLKVSFCDNLPPSLGCADGTDEKEFDRSVANRTEQGFQCPVTRTHVTKNCVLPEQYVCDGDSDCDFGIDECFCEFTEGVKKGKPLNDVYSNDKCFRCLDGSLVIPKIHVCNGIIDCDDLSDECTCPETEGRHKRPDICKSVCKDDSCGCPGQVVCDEKNVTGNVATTEKVCVDVVNICDDTFDCDNNIDEEYCPQDNQTWLCLDGSKKIKNFKLCDGPEDCPDGSDERNCHEITDYFCNEYREYFEVDDWSNKTETKEKVQIPPNVRLDFDRPFFTNKCDGIPMCPGLDDECNSDCPDKYGYCEYITRGFRCPNSGSLIIGVEICDGKPTCNDTAPAESLDEFGCPGRFYCADNGSRRLPIHIPIEHKCDGVKECDDQSDELNCSNKTHFYCNDGGSELFVPKSQVCDGRQDCKEGGDECQECNPSPFSSDEKLIQSRVLIVFLWIIGLVAVIGNLSVIVHQIINLVKPTGQQTAVSISNRILVLNLSTSDLLVGIYLLALGIKDATVSNYCVQDQEWRSSTTCSALGAMALIGTETSVFILLIMTAYRLYLVIRPFKAQKMMVIGIMIVAGWSISFILAFTPFASSAQDYFVSCVWFRSHYFIGQVCRKDLESFTKDLVLYEGSDHMFSNVVKGDYTWSNMFAAMEKMNSSYVPERFFGYYAAHSVCLPRLFPNRETDEAWGYSLFIILINFFAFVFILLSYVHIYRTTTVRNVKKARSEERAAALQTKVTRIVLTDFCCWMPICIMAFLRVAGVPLSDQAYAVTAIILLPINSAMNPFLYSDILDIVWEKMLPLRKWFSATSCGKRVQRKVENRKAKAERPSAPGPNSTTVSPGFTSGETKQYDLQKSPPIMYRNIYFPGDTKSTSLPGHPTVALQQSQVNGKSGQTDNTYELVDQTTNNNDIEVSVSKEEANTRL